MKKIFFILVILVVIAGGITAYSMYSNSQKVKTEFMDIVEKSFNVRERGIKSYTITIVEKTDGDVSKSTNIHEVDIENGVAKLVGQDIQDGVPYESVSYEKLLKDDGSRIEYQRYFDDNYETKWHKNEIDLDGVYTGEDEDYYYFDIELGLNVEDTEKVKEIESDVEGTRKFEVTMTKEYTDFMYDADDEKVIGKEKYIAYVKDGYLYKVFWDIASYVDEDDISVHTIETEINGINTTKVELTDEVLNNVAQNPNWEY